MLTVLKGLDRNAWAVRAFSMNFLHADAIQSEAAEFIDKLEEEEADVVVALPSLRNANEFTPDIVDSIVRVRPRQFLIQYPPNILRVDGEPTYARFARSITARFGDFDYFADWTITKDCQYGVPGETERAWCWGTRSDVSARPWFHSWPAKTHRDPNTVGQMFTGDLPVYPSMADVAGTSTIEVSELLMKVRTAPASFAFPAAMPDPHRFSHARDSVPSFLGHRFAEAMQEEDPLSKSAVVLFCGMGIFASGLEGKYREFSNESTLQAVQAAA